DSKVYFKEMASRGLRAHPEYTEKELRTFGSQKLQKLCGTGPHHLVASMKWGYL
ncbi:unnamed protein product, partial [Symbiodinium sp. KB8]